MKPRPHHATLPYVNKAKSVYVCVSETYSVVITRKIKSRERTSLFRLSGSTRVSDGLHNSAVWACAAVLAHSGGGRPRAQVYCLDANRATGALIRLRTTIPPPSPPTPKHFLSALSAQLVPKRISAKYSFHYLVVKGCARLHQDYLERVMTQRSIKLCDVTKIMISDSVGVNLSSPQGPFK
jgi:hypothetical protein